MQKETFAQHFKGLFYGNFNFKKKTPKRGFQDII